MRKVSSRLQRLSLAVATAGLTAPFLFSSAEQPSLPPLPDFRLEHFPPEVRGHLEDGESRVRENPLDGEAAGRLGMLFQTYGQAELATACYQRARFLEPQVFRWSYYRARMEASLGRHAEAIEAFRDALRVRPDYLPARLKLAESLLAQGEVEESRAIYEDLLQRDPQSAWAHYGLGKVQETRGDSRLALRHYRQACQLYPGFGPAHYALGLLYRDAGETEQARLHLAAYSRHRFSWPPLSDPLLEEVEALNQGGLHSLKRAAELEAAGLLQESVLEHERALEKNPALLQAHVNLISLYGRMGEREKAEQHYRAAVKAHPDLAEAHYNYGVLLVEQNRLEEAASAFRRSLEINPYYAEAHHNLGYLEEQSGRLEAALHHYRLALQYRPNHRLAHFHLGRILLHQGEIQAAIAHFEQTLSETDDQTAGFLYALGAAYARAGNRDKALQYIREARDWAQRLQQNGLLSSIERDLKILEKGAESP